MVLIRSRTLRFAERRHLLRRVGEREQRRRRLVDAGVGRLRRQHHRDQQRERIDVLQLAARLRHRGLEAAERLLDLGLARPAAASSPCSALRVGLGARLRRLDLGGRRPCAAFALAPRPGFAARLAVALVLASIFWP